MTMKNKIHAILLVLAASALTFSCADFLKENPTSLISVDQYYKTPADALTAVNATYFFYNGGGSNGSSQSAYNSLLQVGMAPSTK